MTRKLILDLDTGIDDTLAIAYALASEQADDVRLIGITGTYGNVTVETGMRNALAVTDLLGHPEVSVYPGLDRPSTAPENFRYSPSAGTRRIHGDNGIGDMTIPDSRRSPETTAAADFIIDAAHTYGKDLVIVPTGAMTTIAEVCRREPRIGELVGSITFMGGALTVPGNVTPGAEANIMQDPEAADAILRSGVDAYSATQPELEGCGMHDPLAVAAALDPTLVTTLGMNLQVDLEGAYRGRTIGDRAHDRLTYSHKTTQVAVRVDIARFKSQFLDRITALASH